MPRKIKTLLFSTLFPSSARPLHGIFVETRLRELLKSGRVETRVLAPVPWFPFKHQWFGAYAALSNTPGHEQRGEVTVDHPRYPLPPKVGQNISPYLLAMGSLQTARRLIREGFDFDLIDAHFFYPDGVAAALLARHLRKPFVCTARGSDINLYQQFATPRRLISSTLRQSAGNIGVSADLVRQMVALGADPSKCHTIRNGVDLVRFVPLDRAESRAALGLPAKGRLLLMVGHLVELKGHHLVIELLQGLPNDHLLIVGAGDRLVFLQALAASLGVQARVHFVGQRSNNELKLYYSAADVLLLASSREGWPNVLLEAMACGTPVVATRVNGTPEIVSTPEAGRLAAERSASALRASLDELWANYPERAQVRAFAERYSWAETTQRQVELFDAVLSAHLELGAAGSAQERV